MPFFKKIMLILVVLSSNSETTRSNTVSIRGAGKWQCRLTRKYYLLLKLRTKFGWKCLVFLNSQTLPNNIYWECKFCWQKLRQYFDRNKKDQQLWTIVETQNFYHIICIIHICKDKLQNTILKFTFINFFCPLFFDMVGACNLFRTMTLSQQCKNGFLKKTLLIYFGIYVKFLHWFLEKKLNNSAIEAGRPWEAHYTSKASKSKSEAIFDFSYLNRPAKQRKGRITNSLVSSLLCSPHKNLILLFTSYICRKQNTWNKGRIRYDCGLSSRSIHSVLEKKV